VENAQKAQAVSRVVVSTDDSEISTIAREYGAEVVWRPAEISGDRASSESALLHVLDYLEQTEGYHPELTIFLQCTSPLTLPEDIDGSVQKLIQEDADSTLAVAPFHYFLWQQDQRGNAVGINHDTSVRLLRQEREAQFRETGAIYVMRTQGFKKTKHRFFGKTRIYVMPPERCLEVDDPVDIRIAEVLLRERQQRSKLDALPPTIAALVLDFDGVFTDNRVIVFQDGREAVVADRGDGWALAQLRRQGIALLVLSAEQNPVVKARVDKLGIPCIQGIPDKATVLLEWLREHEIDVSQVVYVGNDVNDLACLQAVGCGVAVNDAHPEAQATARITLSSSGGHGAIREIADLIQQRLGGR
jgi:N-acylneuraminate cytidylyltransferase